MILCGGENLIDLVEEADSSPRRFRAVPGGSPYNCALALGRLGVPTGYLTPISADGFGDDLAARLVAEGVRHLGSRPAAPSALAVVTLRHGTPEYFFHRAGTADRLVTTESLAAAIPETTVALHLGSLALTAGVDALAWEGLFIAQARAGRFTALDPNIRPDLARVDEAAYRARLETMAAAAALIRLSDEDMAWWLPGMSVAAGMAALAARAPSALVFVTQGAGPILCRGPFGGFSLDCAPVPRLADTVGAGDTLMAALLAGLWRRGMLDRAAVSALDETALRPVVADATRAAAITCGRIGCDPPCASELWPGGSVRPQAAIR